MKLNRWCLVLASAGLVTLPSALQAEEQAQPVVLTQLASTTLSGYVDTSMQWNLGTGNANNPPYTYNTPSKADGFNLNVVDIALDKAEIRDPNWKCRTPLSDLRQRLESAF